MQHCPSTLTIMTPRPLLPFPSSPPLAPSPSLSPDIPFKGRGKKKVIPDEEEVYLASLKKQKLSCLETVALFLVSLKYYYPPHVLETTPLANPLTESRMSTRFSGLHISQPPLTTDGSAAIATAIVPLAISWRFYRVNRGHRLFNPRLLEQDEDMNIQSSDNQAILEAGHLGPPQH